jgi:mannose-6-phosphate isomerase-like protein (cupin superfamily)
MSSTIKHERPKHLVDTPLDEIMNRYTKVFSDIIPDWNAFADSQMEGRKRAQHRFIGAGGSGKHDDPNHIPANDLTLSVMYLPPGQGGSAHTHEVDEVFFVLQGIITFFVEDDKGNRVYKRMGPWGCISCPPGVLHGFINEGMEGAYLQTIIGTGRPGPVGFADNSIFESEKAKLRQQGVNV